MRSWQRRFAGKSPDPARKQVGALESDRRLSDAGVSAARVSAARFSAAESQDRGRERERKAPCGLVVRRDLPLVLEVRGDPAQRRQPEEHRSECAQREQPERVAAPEVHRLVREYGSELVRGEAVGKVRCHEHAGCQPPRHERRRGKAVDHAHSSEAQARARGGLGDQGSGHHGTQRERTHHARMTNERRSPLEQHVDDAGVEQIVREFVHGCEQQMQRDEAEDAEMHLRRGEPWYGAEEMVAEHRTHPEQDRRDDREEQGASTALLPMHQRDRRRRVDAERRQHQPCRSRSLRRIRRASSSSWAGSRSARTSTIEAVTASVPSERIPSTTRRDARVTNADSSRSGA